jgi:hypothetical protein
LLNFKSFEIKMKSWNFLTAKDFVERKRCPNQGSYGQTEFCKLSPAFKNLNVVLKTNSDIFSSDLQHEYRVAKRLEKVNARGFSRALHFFTENDKQYLVLERVRSEQSLLAAMLVMNPDQILSVVKQLIVLLWEAQNKVRFVHNDLHLNNILLCKTSMKHFLWQGGKFPTFGFTPVFIDFGFSHFDEWMQYPISTQCSQTHRGMNPFNFDEKFDFLTLLHSVRKDCSFDKCLKKTISSMIETVGEYKLYKNFRWRKMEYSIFDLMIVLCEFPTTRPGCDDDSDDSPSWKTVGVESEKLRQERLLFEAIKFINPKSSGYMYFDLAGKWNTYRLTGVVDEHLISSLEFIFYRFLQQGQGRKPLDQNSIEKLLSCG